MSCLSNIRSALTDLIHTGPPERAFRVFDYTIGRLPRPCLFCSLLVRSRFRFRFFPGDLIPGKACHVVTFNPIPQPSTG